MITLNASAKARKRFRLTVSEKAETGHWHEQWRLDVIEPKLCGQAAIFTNLATLFSILVPVEESATFVAAYRYFCTRLQFTLIDARSDLTVENTPPQIVTGNPRAVIGTINDMKFALEVENDHAPVPGRDPELFLNRTPYSMIDYQYPVDRFYEMAENGTMPN